MQLLCVECTPEDGLQLELGCYQHAKLACIRVVQIREPVNEVDPEKLEDVLHPVPHLHIGCSRGKVACSQSRIPTRGEYRDKSPVGTGESAINDIGGAYQPPFKLVH